MTYLLALDQGTSSSRSIVFDRDGRIRAIAQRELAQHYPRPGWVEHDPLAIWSGQRDTAREALAKAGIAARDVAAVGIANQRETTIVWERATGRPIRNAIVWQDRRTEPACARLRADGAVGTIRAKTGLVVDAYFSATKLAWLLDEVDGARAAAERGELAFGTVDTWLLWRLTGGRVHATDVSNASRTMLFDIHAQRWDDELLALFRVPRALLPEVHPSSHRFGDVDADVLGRALPIGGVAGDQQAALFGQACFDAGMAKNTYGTGCFLLMHSGSEALASDNGLVSTSAAVRGPAPRYALEGSVFVGGAVVQWLRDGLKAIEGSHEVQALAETVPDAGGVMMVPAFTGLGAPYWDANARGTIVGLTRGTTIGHVARAALESIAFQSAALFDAMRRDAAKLTAAWEASSTAHSASAFDELRVDGGACVNDLLMQFQADLLGIPVVRPAVVETTALGAAFLAGLAVGAYADEREIAALWRRERTFVPTMPREQAETAMARWAHAVRKATAA